MQAYISGKPVAIPTAIAANRLLPAAYASFVRLLIGFFVAAVIKLIAYAADSFDFYSSHRLELLRLRRWRQHRQKVERLVRQIPIADEDALGDSREDYSRGIDRNFTGYSGYYHGVSPGASENNLVNYYYSQDTREFFLREEEQAHVNKKNSKKLTNNKQ